MKDISIIDAVYIMDFDLNLLKVFDALIEEGNATRAAVQLGVSQAAVSAALGRLRRIYGDVLFTRVPGGLAPTARAMEIKPLLSEALASVSKSLGKQAPVEVERYLRIGLSDDIEIGYGQKLIAAIRRTYPLARPVLRQTHSAVAGDMLRHREIDLAIGSGGLTGRGLQRQSVGQSGYLSLSYQAPKGRRGFTLEEFLKREHVLISSSGLVGIVDEALAVLGRKRHIAASTSHFAATQFLLRGTDFIATMPSHAARALGQDRALYVGACPLALKTYPIEIGINLATSRDPFIADATRIVASCLKRLIG
jgi:DNA-binding transcriptional LysR family regulator